MPHTILYETTFGSIKICRTTPYPCTQPPEIQYDATGAAQKIVTASTQVKVSADGTQTVFAPSLYQNCMRPEEITILPLTLEFLPSGLLRLSTRYSHAEVSIAAADIQTADWQAVFHPSDCIHCTNCGRCGW
ncbi:MULTISPECIES: hypothetical protein [Caproicibacterium]|uniref:Uncharacterized protein n=1 Tax=Caproicibacterium argilliputei TaxID=3030016 RepID=A0AA97DAA0_9FIRM|nr:hypothetical protein [Caproicibacterium argilliputei]WOC32649.1 hypothetical protein PXC00_01900 [Caproicibacterium argilliputei]